MLSVVRSNCENKDFIDLTKQLDDDLSERYGAIQSDYNRFNVIKSLDTVVIAYVEGTPVGCGCFKIYTDEIAEIKRMYVKPENRGMGISKTILSELEDWAFELGFSKLILETGIKQHEAIGLYKRCGFVRIENYDQYVGMSHSICFEKEL